MLPRVYPILDTASVERRGLAPVRFASALLDGGARILQLRHKGPLTRDVFESFRVVCALCEAAGASAVINDCADVAALLDAGLHLGQFDLPPALARRLVPTRLLGFSTHNAAQLAAAADVPADYLAIGPIFATSSKDRPDPVLGLEALPALRRLTAKPLVAIGGITRSTARAVLDAGADSVAVIGDLLTETMSESSVRDRMKEWLKAAT